MIRPGRRSGLLALAAAVLVLAGCASPAPEPDPTVTRTPTPVPRPTGTSAAVAAIPWQPSGATQVLETGLEAPQAFHAAGGGRRGRHSEHLAPLLAELQVLARQHPGASW